MEKSSRVIRIGSRGSQLALTQTEEVKTRLQRAFPSTEFHVEIIKTKGDKILDVALSKIGDKGLFTKELEIALLDKTIDLAVHSLKDIPTKLPEGLTVGCICERHQMNDCVVMREAEHGAKKLKDLPPGSIIGSSSLRRVAQLKRAYPHLQFEDIRGNLNTRLQKLDGGTYDALILAVAGLSRLQMEKRITEILPTEVCKYAVGQGALAIECREDDEELLAMLKSIHHEYTARCCEAERAFLLGVEGGCQVPVGVNTTVKEGALKLEGIILSIDGQTTVEGEVTGKMENAKEIGEELAKKLKEQGGGKILEDIISTLKRESSEK